MRLQSGILPILRNTICTGLILLVAGLAGCTGMGYTLGSTLPPGARSVQVPTFINHCGEPRLETEATQAVISELQKDGTLEVVDRDTADFVLKVTLVSCDMKPLRYQRDNAKATSEYRVELSADILMTRTSTKNVAITKRVRGEYDFYTGSDMQSAKRIALPGACRDLAHDIVETVTEYWYD